MFKPLIKTIPSISGNVKLACYITDYEKSNYETNIYNAYVREANLLPVNSELWQANVPARLCMSTWEYDLFKFYKFYSEYFWKSTFTFNKSDLSIVDFVTCQKNRNSDFEFGCKRVSSKKNKNNEYAFFAPIWFTGVDDLPDYFEIKLEISNNLYSINKYIRIQLKAEGEHTDSYVDINTNTVEYVAQVDSDGNYILDSDGNYIDQFGNPIINELDTTSLSDQSISVQLEINENNKVVVNSTLDSVIIPDETKKLLTTKTYEYKYDTYNKNYLAKYLYEYAEKIDDNILYINSKNQTGTFYGIDIKRGGFGERTITVSNLFNKQNTICNFDASINNNFEIQRLVVKQIMPLCFYFTLDEVLTDIEKDKYNAAKVKVTGNYYKDNKKVNLYDLSTNYDTFYQKVLQFDINSAMFKTVDTNINIMDIPSDKYYNSLHEATYYKYYYNKLKPKANQWKLKTSSDDDPYIINTSIAFSNNQNSLYKYKFFPIKSQYTTGISIKQPNGLYDFILPLNKNSLAINGTPYYNHVSSINKYNIIQNNYNNTWYNTNDTMNSIFDNDKLWVDVINNSAYYNNVLYNFDVLYNKYPELIDINIDKFAVILNTNLTYIDPAYIKTFINTESIIIRQNSLLDKENYSIIESRNCNIQDSFITDYYTTFVNNTTNVDGKPHLYNLYTLDNNNNYTSAPKSDIYMTDILFEVKKPVASDYDKNGNRKIDSLGDFINLQDIIHDDYVYKINEYVNYDDLYTLVNNYFMKKCPNNKQFMTSKESIYYFVKNIFKLLIEDTYNNKVNKACYNEGYVILPINYSDVLVNDNFNFNIPSAQKIGYNNLNYFKNNLYYSTINNIESKYNVYNSETNTFNMAANVDNYNQLKTDLFGITYYIKTNLIHIYEINKIIENIDNYIKTYFVSTLKTTKTENYFTYKSRESFRKSYEQFDILNEWNDKNWETILFPNIISCKHIDDIWAQHSMQDIDKKQQVILLDILQTTILKYRDELIKYYYKPYLKYGNITYAKEVFVNELSNTTKFYGNHIPVKEIKKDNNVIYIDSYNVHNYNKLKTSTGELGVDYWCSILKSSDEPIITITVENTIISIHSILSTIFKSLQFSDILTAQSIKDYKNENFKDIKSTNIIFSVLENFHNSIKEIINKTSYEYITNTKIFDYCNLNNINIEVRKNELNQDVLYIYLIKNIYIPNEKFVFKTKNKFLNLDHISYYLYCLYKQPFINDNHTLSALTKNGHYLEIMNYYFNSSIQKNEDEKLYLKHKLCTVTINDIYIRQRVVVNNFNLTNISMPKYGIYDKYIKLYDYVYDKLKNMQSKSKTYIDMSNLLFNALNNYTNSISFINNYVKYDSNKKLFSIPLLSETDKFDICYDSYNIKINKQLWDILGIEENVNSFNDMYLYSIEMPEDYNYNMSLFDNNYYDELTNYETITNIDCCCKPLFYNIKKEEKNNSYIYSEYIISNIQTDIITNILYYNKMNNEYDYIYLYRINCKDVFMLFDISNYKTDNMKDMFNDILQQNKNISSYTIYNKLNANISNYSNVVNFNQYSSKFYDNLNIYTDNKGITYAFYYIQLNIDNTSSTFNVVTNTGVQTKIITYINNQPIKTMSQLHINNNIKLWLPFIKISLVGVFFSKINTIINQTKVKFNDTYASSNIFNSDLTLIKLCKQRSTQTNLLRYFTNVTPYIKESLILYDYYMLIFKQCEANILNENLPLSVKNSVIRKFTLSTENYPGILFFVNDYAHNNSKLNSFKHIEYKWFNDNQFIALPKLIEIDYPIYVQYNKLIELESDANTFDVFKNYINKERKNTYTNNELLFLYNRYDKKYDTCTQIVSNNVKKYSLKYIFELY